MTASPSWSDGDVVLLDSAQSQGGAESKASSDPVLKNLPDDIAVLVLKLRKRYAGGKRIVLRPEPSWRKRDKPPPKKKADKKAKGGQPGKPPGGGFPRRPRRRGR